MTVDPSVEGRRAAFPRDYLTRAGIAWIVVSTLLVLINWTAITTQRFPDPDDTMRLLQVRDLIAGQNWFDLTQTRVDAVNGGVAMHWSRLVDVPLALVIVALTPIIGAAAAESAALIAVPLLTLGCAIALASRIAWRLLGDEEANFTALVMVISVPLLFQLGPMRIDHHGWQIVCALAAMNGLMARSPRTGGWVIGGALATWLSISVEGLPLAAAFFAVLALRWLKSSDARVWLASAIQSLALVGWSLFALTRGLGDLATYCDALGPAYLAMFTWGAVVLSTLAFANPASRLMLIAGFGIAGGGAIGLLLYLAPQCASGGGFAALDPIVARYWHANVLEGMPIWRQSLTVALQYAVTPIVGLIAAIRLMQRSKAWLKDFWSDHALLVSGALIIAIFVSRAGAVACAIAAPPLAWQLRQWLGAIRKMETPPKRMLSMLGVVCVLLPALPAMIVSNAIPSAASVGGSGDTLVKAADCRVQDAGAGLATLPPGEFFAPLDIAPELLLVSSHSVIATGHHRGNAGMKVLIETAIAPPEQALETLGRRGTDYVALCPGLGEARLYSRIAPDGFVARLVRGDAPDWLEPVEIEGPEGLKLWRIRPR